jgi:transposase
MGRKSKLKEVREELLKYIALGVPNEHACHAVGINEHTLYNWINRGKEAQRKTNHYFQFLQDYKKAKSKSVVRNVAVIEKYAKEKDWKAAAWLLERRYPDQFGKREYRTSDVKLSGYDVLRELVRDDDESGSDDTDS